MHPNSCFLLFTVATSLLMAVSAVTSADDQSMLPQEASGPGSSFSAPWSIAVQNPDGISTVLIGADERYLVFLDRSQGSFAVKVPGLQPSHTAETTMHPYVRFSRGHGLHLGLTGFDASRVSGEAMVDEKLSFFLGDDSASWLSAIPVFERVRYENLYDGIDLTVSFEPYLETYRFEVAPGADPSLITLQPGSPFEGTVEAEQVGRRYPIDADFRFEPYVGSRIQVGRHDESSTLHISVAVQHPVPVSLDPDGRGNESLSLEKTRVVRAESGIFWTVGEAAVAGDGGVMQQIRQGDPAQVAVTRFDENREMTATTFVSGATVDRTAVAASSRGIALWGRGVARLAPCRPSTGDSASVEFLLELDHRGIMKSCRSWSAAARDDAQVMAYDATGRLWLATRRPAGKIDLPITFDGRSGKQGTPLQVAVFDPADDLRLIASGFLPGGGPDVAAMATAGDGSIFLAGRAPLGDLAPTEGAYQQVFAGGTRDSFLQRLTLGNEEDIEVVAATYLGGSSQSNFDVDDVTSLAPGPGGSLWVGGTTSSKDLGFRDTAAQQSNPGAESGFIARFDSGLTRLLAGSYLGGENDDSISAIAADESGNLWVVGITNSLNFPQRRARVHLDEESHVFIARFNAAGTAVVESMLLGGSNKGYSGSLISTDDGRALVAGQSTALLNPEKHPPERNWDASKRLMLLEASPCRVCTEPPQITRLMDSRAQDGSVSLELDRGQIKQIFSDGEPANFERMTDGRLTIEATPETRELTLINSEGDSATVILDPIATAPAIATTSSVDGSDFPVWVLAIAVVLSGLFVVNRMRANRG